MYSMLLLKNQKNKLKEIFEKIMFLEEYRSTMLGSTPCSSYPTISSREEYLNCLELQIDSPATIGKSLLNNIRDDPTGANIGLDIPLAECKRTLLNEAHLSVLKNRSNLNKTTI
eukprot:gnl/Chilomastix_caulleri/5753.p1 GENE.gnl/Chilomastix_caulleri/5753~~gnl/Chilomastix_caulleri/5753.p1  ORF type:complete len:114 (+),score=14.19 gnl/Chilomastix_caulleri/5753:153-494(+)